MKKLILMVIFYTTIFCALCQAAFERRELGARAAAMSGAYGALAQNGSAPFWNVAGLSSVSSCEFESHYSQLFSLSDLSLYGASIASALPFKRAGALAFSYSSFGNRIYKEQELYFSHGIAANSFFQAGYSFKTLILKMDEFGSSVSVGLDLAMQIKPQERWIFATVLRNVNRPKISGGKEILDRSWSSSASFYAFKNWVMVAEIERSLEQPVNFKFGSQWTMFDHFSLRSGAQTLPARYTAGFGVTVYSMQFDYAYQHYLDLSATHSFSLSMRFGAPKLALKVAEPKTQKTITFPLILSSATWQDLSEVASINKSLAKRIIDYRDRQAIQKIDDLLNVPEMSKKAFLSLKKYVIMNQEFKDIKAVEGVDRFENLNWARLNRLNKKDLISCGLSEQAAQNIVRSRRRNGAFKNKKELLTVPWFNQNSWESLLRCLKE